MFRAPLLAFFLIPLLASDSPSYRSDVTLVRAEARVYQAGTGSLIPDLKAADFVLRDGETRREIVYFTHDEEPLDLILLLDVSGTMLEMLPEVAAKAGAALRELHAGDRVAVEIFGKASLITQPFTEDFHAVERGLRELMSPRVGLDTDINSAVLFAARYARSQRRQARRAILAITDNMQASLTPSGTVDRELFEAGAVLDGIVLTARVRLPSFVSGRGGVYRFAEKTGGEVLEGTHPADKLRDIIQRIRARYSLYFRPVEAVGAKPHRIHIDLSPQARRRYPKAVVRGRTEYHPFTPPLVKELKA